MLKFKYPGTYPLDGVFRYHVPETHTDFSDSSEERLLNAVTQHLVANGFEVPQDLGLRMQDFMCRRMAKSACVGTPDPGAPVFRAITPAMIVDFSRLLARKAMLAAQGRSDEAFVTVAEATRRAEICASCPLNLASVCTTCDGLKGSAGRLLYDPRTQVTKFDDKLRACAICGCLLQAKVHYSLEVIVNTFDVKYPVWCWMQAPGGHVPTAQEIADYERDSKR